MAMTEPHFGSCLQDEFLFFYAEKLELRIDAVSPPATTDFLAQRTLAELLLAAQIGEPQGRRRSIFSLAERLRHACSLLKDGEQQEQAGRYLAARESWRMADHAWQKIAHSSACKQALAAQASQRGFARPVELAKNTLAAITTELLPVLHAKWYIVQATRAAPSRLQQRHLAYHAKQLLSFAPGYDAPIGLRQVRAWLDLAMANPRGALPATYEMLSRCEFLYKTYPQDAPVRRSLRAAALDQYRNRYLHDDRVQHGKHAQEFAASLDKYVENGVADRTLLDLKSLYAGLAGSTQFDAWLRVQDETIEIARPSACREPDCLGAIGKDGCCTYSGAYRPGDRDDTSIAPPGAIHPLHDGMLRLAEARLYDPSCALAENRLNLARGLAEAMPSGDEQEALPEPLLSLQKVLQEGLLRVDQYCEGEAAQAILQAGAAADAQPQAEPLAPALDLFVKTLGVSKRRRISLPQRARLASHHAWIWIFSTQDMLAKAVALGGLLLAWASLLSHGYYLVQHWRQENRYRALLASVRAHDNLATIATAYRFLDALGDDSDPRLPQVASYLEDATLQESFSEIHAGQEAKASELLHRFETYASQLPLARAYQEKAQPEPEPEPEPDAEAEAESHDEEKAQEQEP